MTRRHVTWLDPRTRVVCRLPRKLDLRLTVSRDGRLVRLDERDRPGVRRSGSTGGLAGVPEMAAGLLRDMLEDAAGRWEPVSTSRSRLAECRLWRRGMERPTLSGMLSELDPEGHRHVAEEEAWDDAPRGEEGR